MRVFILEGEFDAQKVRNWAGKLLFFNPDLVLDENHVAFALWHAKRAMKNGTNIARDLPLEFLVRLSGRRQIKKAMEFAPKSAIGVCVLEGDIDEFCREFDMKILGESLMPSKEKKKSLSKAFGINEDSTEFEKKIFEHIAMTDV